MKKLTWYGLTCLDRKYTYNAHCAAILLSRRNKTYTVYKQKD